MPRPDAKRWIDATESARILELPGPANVDALVEEGLIFRRDLPGTRHRYLASDVEALARLNTPREPKSPS